MVILKSDEVNWDKKISFLLHLSPSLSLSSFFSILWHSWVNYFFTQVRLISILFDVRLLYYIRLSTDVIVLFFSEGTSRMISRVPTRWIDVNRAMEHIIQLIITPWSCKRFSRWQKYNDILKEKKRKEFVWL